MNKRDKFAMAAMQAIISKPTSYAHMPFAYEAQQVAEEIAQESYIYADALLAEGSETTEVSPETDGERSEHPCKGGCEACVGCNASDSQEHFEVVKQPEKFEPFYIKVHDQATCNYLSALVGSSSSDIDGAFGVGDTAYQLYDYLQLYAEDNYPRIDCKLRNTN